MLSERPHGGTIAAVGSASSSHGPTFSQISLKVEKQLLRYSANKQTDKVGSLIISTEVLFSVLRSVDMTVYTVYTACTGFD